MPACARSRRSACRTAHLADEADAVVVALKSRTIPAREAIAQSLDALRWLKAHGARQIYFKYCSTFDSTSAGNIGPVIDALLDALEGAGAGFTIATPAFPDNQRAVFKGHLFVGDVLLHESGMQHHPLTPMTDSNLVRVLQAQCTRRVGSIDYRVVARGAAAIRARIGELRAHGVGIAIVDAISNRRPARHRRRCARHAAGHGRVGCRDGTARKLRHRAIRRGRCAATRTWPARDRFGQLLRRDAAAGRFLRRLAAAGVPSRPLAYRSGRRRRRRSAPWATPLLADPGAGVLDRRTRRRHRHPARLGVRQAGDMVEGVLATIARGLVERGVRQLVIAGGETAGACVQALGVAQLQIGPQIDPGVPWCHALTDVGGERRDSPGAEVRQLRLRRLLHALVRAAAMTEYQAREEICRVGRSLFERGYVHGTTGNISVRLAESEGGGYLITPTDACLGFLDPLRLARLDSEAARSAASAASKTVSLHAQIYAAARRFDPATACIMHTHSTHCVALTLTANAIELLPPITPYFVMKVGHVPLIAYHRPGSKEVGDAVAEAIDRYGDAGTAIRAVMLSRLGPNVWHDSPAKAMALVEELEETARLVALGGPLLEPLTDAAIDELRRTFGARW